MAQAKIWGEVGSQIAVAAFLVVFAGKKRGVSCRAPGRRNSGEKPATAQHYSQDTSVIGPDCFFEYPIGWAVYRPHLHGTGPMHLLQ